MPVLNLDAGPLLLPLRDKRQPTEGLRIGVVVEGESVRRWQKEFIDWLGGIESLHVVEIYSAGKSTARPTSSKLFDLLHRRSCAVYDPFVDVPLVPEYSPANMEFPGTAAAGLDIVIWLTPERSLPKTFPSAKFGIISFQLGRGRNILPYWDEVARGEVLSEACVWWHAHSLDRARKIRAAELPTDLGLTFTRNAAQPLVALAQMAATVCIEILEEGEGWVAKASKIPEVNMSPPTPASLPSAVETANFAFQKLARSLKGRLQHRGRRAGWLVALRPNDAHSYLHSRRFSAEGLQAIPLPPDSQMADPFLVDHEGRTFLYFEEVPSRRNIGRLNCAEIRNDGSVSDATLILEDERSLSYPCVFRHKDEFFMIPESAEQRHISLYRAAQMPYRFNLETTYLQNVMMVDTTPLLLDGTWYFFTTTAEPFMQTLLFWSDQLDGKWHLHPKSPISSSAQNSRSAGAIKLTNGHILRPTQDCSVRYGYAIVVNEILRLTRTEFEERPIDRLLPNWRKRLLGTHTWNCSSKFEVFDGLRHL